VARSTVAVLFSDIEGSTRLLQTLGPGYVDLLLTHRTLLREAFARHEGAERGIEGDSFFMTFPTAHDAVAAARDAQLALTEHDWSTYATTVRVRMGIHVGAVELLDDMVFGMAVHETARLSAAAHGGQVLVSETAQQLADPLPDPCGWLDLGSHHLKDVPHPVHILQLTHPGLAADFPPLRLQGGVRTALPQPSSSFIGRAPELAAVRTLLAESRLVTLTGTGGVGKTRIALRVAAEHIERFTDGVDLVDLAQVDDPEAVLPAVATTVGSRAATTTDLVDDLHDRHRLLVVDNCEHLLESVASLVDDVIRGTRTVTVLATSREPLGVGGEVVWRVPPMSEEDARTLLAVRAHAVNAGFAVSEANRPSVDEVCRRLDAIPLALELAAARMTSLTPEQVAQRLDQRFRLLSGGARGSLERHRTLQATVDWSYDHLEPTEQELLRRLGVFTGGFPLEGAESVAGDVDPITVLDTLDSLVQKSLVIADERGGAVRYRLLETIRQYALDRLGTSADARAARQAHLRWIEGLCRAARDDLWFGPAHRWLDQLDHEQANIRSAFEWARGTAPEQAVSLLFCTLPWVIARATSREWIEPCSQLVELELSPQGHATARVLLLWLHSNAGPVPQEQVSGVAEVVSALDGHEPEWFAPTTRSALAAWSYSPGDAAGAEAAIAGCRAALEAGRDFPAGIQTVLLQSLVWVSLDSGRLDEARTAAEAALASATAAGSFMEGRMALNVARVDLAAGRIADAEAFAGRAVSVARATGDTFVATVATRLMARIAEDEGRFETARDLLAGILDEVAQTQTNDQLGAVRADLGRCAALAGADT
jgi:predicted ATPase/class 3 adenylate cyclase